ncbi:MAG: hypothetical protein HZA31_13650 [Opitutae bacterium]|nr:hypothetical protein [Opitutae bacterium]
MNDFLAPLWGMLPLCSTAIKALLVKMKTCCRSLLLIALFATSLRAEEVQIIGTLFFTPKHDGWKIRQLTTSKEEIRTIFQAEKKGRYIGIDEMVIIVQVYSGRFSKLEAVKKLQLSSIASGQQHHPIAFREELARISGVDFPAILAELPTAKGTLSATFVWIQLPDSVVEVEAICPNDMKNGRASLLSELSIRTP